MEQGSGARGSLKLEHESTSLTYGAWQAPKRERNEFVGTCATTTTLTSFTESLMGPRGR